MASFLDNHNVERATAAICQARKQKAACCAITPASVPGMPTPETGAEVWLDDVDDAPQIAQRLADAMTVCWDTWPGQQLWQIVTSTSPAITNAAPLISISHPQVVSVFHSRFADS